MKFFRVSEDYTEHIHSPDQGSQQLSSSQIPAIGTQTKLPTSLPLLSREAKEE